MGSFLASLLLDKDVLSSGRFFEGVDDDVLAAEYNGLFVDGVSLLEDLFLKLLETSEASHRRLCMDDSILPGMSGTLMLCSGIMS